MTGMSHPFVRKGVTQRSLATADIPSRNGQKIYPELPATGQKLGNGLLYLHQFDVKEPAIIYTYFYTFCQ
jgi:hypothetical protein